MDISIIHMNQNLELQSIEDLDLINRVKKKDRLAQAELYRKYHTKWLCTCMRYFDNKDDALEALNHSFLKIFNKISSYKTDMSFAAWGYRIVQRTAIDYARKKIKKGDFVKMDALEKEAFVSTDYTSSMLPDEWISLLQALPNATRIVFNLVALEGYKHREISKLLNISEGTSKWHLSQARRILKSKIEGGKND